MLHWRGNDSQVAGRERPKWRALALLATACLIAHTAAAHGQDQLRSPAGGVQSQADNSSNRPYVLPRRDSLQAGAADAPSTAQAPVEQASSDLGAAPRRSQADEPIPLLPPDDPQMTAPPPRSPAGALWTVISSLAVVLGLFFAVAMLGRRASVGGPAILPTEAFEVLGRASLTGRQQAQVVRFGDKLILLAVSANGVESLAEVTSAEEVERIAALCQQQRPDSVTQSFRQVLSQFSREPAQAGFVGEESEESPAADDEKLSEFERLA